MPVLVKLSKLGAIFSGNKQEINFSQEPENCWFKTTFKASKFLNPCILQLPVTLAPEKQPWLLN